MKKVKSKNSKVKIKERSKGFTHEKLVKVFVLDAASGAETVTRETNFIDRSTWIRAADWGVGSDLRKMLKVKSVPAVLR